MRKTIMVKLSFNKLTLAFIGLSTVFCTFCLAKAQAPRVRTGRPPAPRPAPQRPAAVKPAEKPATIVAGIGNYTITDQELEKRFLQEIRPNNYGNYNEEPEPVKTDKVLVKMIAEKAVISEARKGDYLKDESLSSIIKR
jgi:hypothetical protein